LVVDARMRSETMSLEDRVKALQERHADLEKRLDDEESRPLPDYVVLHDIKRQKLAIKDELQRLNHC